MTSKLEQVLQIRPPDELHFKGYFSDSITVIMTLINPSAKRIMYKIKTTAPKKYCVRPNCGILNPNEISEISISLQPCMYEPTERGKHKFLVQSAFAPPGEVNMENIWKDIIPEHLMESKLKCTFDIDSKEEYQSGEPYDFVPDTASTPVAASSQKVTHEILTNIQREEDSILKMENQKLRDQIMKLEMEKQASLSPLCIKDGIAQISFNWMHFCISVVVGIVGIIFGKYWL
ncbi:vesicle-associated membrane protein-associated protein A-like [Diorhabda carinulata]|uniref:vesicle-associated membrane protein-associated protein A-like n=1 Tax=Diorhabda carinulata TaxID=1163345 RepID=UPI0025A12AD5|nr:vesicle-associated membrane protein-associated protein A-like [Diorhabda carinulata]